tara:strand:- start:509 stop:1063 length:555 start_codon:yes stop_codon:yes gene_type:complete
MRYKTKEFIVATEYKPKLGKLYYLGADGNIYETTMGPKSKGYKAPMVVELNLKREKGWLYYIERNPGVVYDIVENEKNARYPEDSVLEVWRYLESSEYGVSDMTKEEILQEILEDWEYVSESMTDEELNEDRGESINHSRSFFGEDERADEIEADLHTIAIQLEQIRRFGKIVYKSERIERNKS